MFDDSFSPVKIDKVSISPYPITEITNMNHKTPPKLVHHPHGLAAKHEARRNSSNSIMTKVETTPALPKPLISRTSPRSRNVVNLESIRKSKLKIDQQYKLAFDDRINKSGSEHEIHLDLSSPDMIEETYSSPIKRGKQDGGNKKKLMKLNELEVIDLDDEEVEKVEEEEEVYVEDHMPDSDEFNEHQDHIKTDSVTPHRYTELNAEIPHLDQHDRINYPTSRVKQSSPLRRDTFTLNEFDDTTIHTQQLENEPTINFLMSPNSKPVYSVEYVNDIHEKNKHRISTLLEQLEKNDQLILNLNDEINTLKNENITNQQYIRNLQDTESRLIQSEEMLTIELRSKDRELASLIKNSKINENSNKNLKRKIISVEHEIDQVKNERTQLVEDIEQAQNLISELKNEKIKLTLKLDDVIKENEELASSEDIHKLNQQNSELNLKIEKLNQENSENTFEIEKLTTENERRQNKIDDLIEEGHILKNKLDDKQKEIENLNDVIITTTVPLKNYNLLHSQYEELKDELTTTHEEIEQINNKMNNSVPLEKFTDLHSKYETLSTQFNEKQDELKLARSKIYDTISIEEYNIIKSQYENLKQEHESSLIGNEAKLKSLTDEIKFKEEEIVEYHKNMENLMIATDQLKETNEEYLKEKQKMQKQQEIEVDNLAKYLHKEYAEKHAKKLGEVKDHYEDERKDYQKKIKNLERELALTKNSFSHNDNSSRN